MGGSPSIPQRNLTDELGQTFGAFRSTDLPTFNNQWFNQQPLLSGSRTLAEQGFPVGASALADISGLQAPFRNALSYLMPIIQSGGMENPEQGRAEDQNVRNAFSAAGNAHGNQAAVAQVLNRDQYRQQRFNTALAQATGATQELQGVTNTALGAESGAINPALNTEQTAVGTYATLLNPLLSYASDLFSSNQNAAAAQSIAGANKGSGLAGGAMSAIGAIAPALIGLSDERVKTDIKPVTKRVKGRVIEDETPEGIPIKTFRYRGDKRRFKGVIAQDVEKVRPDAVLTMPVTGHKLVNLSALPGVNFEELRKFLPSRKVA